MRQVLVPLSLAVASFVAFYSLVKVSQPKASPPEPVPVAVTPTGQEPVASGNVDPAGTDAPSGAPEGMVWIRGGAFVMGTNDKTAWPDERPAHRVRVSGFFMDATEVTNAEFERFVNATGHVTTAEIPPSLEEIMKQLPPDTPPPSKENLAPGAVVFRQSEKPVPLDNVSRWWFWTKGANWRHPEGPESDLNGREQHPVVQVSWDDAVAYAKWAGKRLPTEAEWEFASRGGLDSQPYVWGSDPPSASHPQANLWEGRFPSSNSKEDGWVRTAPVKSYKPNGYGLYDMSGNVWEWCSDWYDKAEYRRRADTDLVEDPSGPSKSFDPNQPFTPLRSQRGGSFLCNDAYCTRYRPSARHGCSPDTGMSHVGFRCVKSPDAK